jgi:hypothetical protein
VHYHAASKDGSILEGHSLILETKPHLGYSHVNKFLSCLVLVSLSPFAVSQASFAWLVASWMKAWWCGAQRSGDAVHV